MAPPPSATLPVNITIHGLDHDLAEAFRDYAAKAGQSLNAAAKELFRRALGIPTVEEQVRIDAWKRWQERYGHFSEEELRPLREALELQSQIEPEMWK